MLAKNRLLAQALRGVVESVADARLRADLSSILGQLADGFQAVGRIMEFEADDAHFILRPIAVCDWLDSMNSAYGQRYEPVDLTIPPKVDRKRAEIWASDYLLRLIFWNLWVNAQQAVEGLCRIRVDVSIDGNVVTLLVIDNGTGFSPDSVGVAFQEQFSSNGFQRGRGLLEVQDAVLRLQGSARLVQHQTGTYRVALTFPLKER